MGYWVELALRPLRQFADFRGRSTRSEIAAFYVLMTVVTGGLTLLSDMLVPSGQGKWAVQDIAELAFLCPVLALSVRRLHDQGRSGWWLLVLLPVFIGGAWQFYRTGFSLDPIAKLQHPLPGLVHAALALCVLVYMALLIWKDEEGTNRWGPNPRYTETPDIALHNRA